MMGAMTETLQQAIAAAAARLIAEEGLDYQAAKKKAVKQMGLTGERVDWPDNDQVEQALQDWYAELAEDDPEAEAERQEELRRLRELALAWMERLTDWNPALTGAVWNGTANEHSVVHLALFTDDDKLLEIELLNRDVAYEVAEPTARQDEASSTLVVHDEDIPVILTIYPARLQHSRARSGDGRALRGDAQAVRALLN